MSKNLKTQIEELKHGWQRTQADFENYKNRAEQDKTGWSRGAKTETLEKILPILDNLSLAASHTPDDLKDNAWAQGIAHICQQIESTFAELGIAKIEPKAGDKFDPGQEEAVATEISTKYPEGHILNCRSAGYKVENVLIRPAKVIVSAKKGN